jgi:septal ring factor EnvC (AmiA/AmiB activator)
MRLLPAIPAASPLLAAMLALSPLGLMAASAQTPLPQPRTPPAAEDKQSAPPVSLDSLKRRDKELEALRAEQRKTLEKEAKLKREIELIGDDRRKFNQQIIETASRVAAVEERIEKTQQSLAPLDDSEQALRISLAQRHDLIAEVLAALQRIGRHAPPALMIRAEDALQSVRSAMVLGAVLQRQQAEGFALRARAAAKRSESATKVSAGISLAVEAEARNCDFEAQVARRQPKPNQLPEHGLIRPRAPRGGRTAARTAGPRETGRAALKDPGRLTPNCLCVGGDCCRCL